jgi:hypothetical protein
MIEVITFGYCLNLTFKDENQYYGKKSLWVMCKINVWEYILRTILRANE